MTNIPRNTIIRQELVCGISWGQPSAVDSSWISEDSHFITTDCMAFQTILARGYQIIPRENLLYLKVVEKLWKYLVDEAEHFSSDQMEVIEKEFWNLG